MIRGHTVKWETDKIEENPKSMEGKSKLNAGVKSRVKTRGATGVIKNKVKE